MIAIISDIHGNFPALQAVLKAIDEQGCTRIISLGDVAGYYSMINECIEALHKRNVVNIKGNHDHYLLTGTFCPRSNSANRCLEYQASVISPDNRQWLQNSVDQLNEQDMSFVHGGWTDLLDEYMAKIDESYFDSFAQRFFFSGHTHVQVKMPIGKKLYCNPGSVGQPRDGDPRAAFALISGTNVQLFRVAYDIDYIAFQMKKAGFSSHYYDNLYMGTKIGGGISRINYC